MSVLEVLEKFERKHESPSDDKSGWKRLIHGAVTKAAGVLWTTGGSVEVTLGPNSFSEMQSPPRDDYLSLSVKSEDSEEIYFSFDETCGRGKVPDNKKCLTPKHHSTPYKDDMKSDPPEGSNEKSFESSDNVVKSLSKKGEKNRSHIEGSHAPDLSDLCYEMERLSLKKMIVEVEKSIALEIKEEFDKERWKIEEHDRRVAEILSKEREEKEMEEELMEMNWFQKIRESQLQAEQDFNAKLDAILSRSNMNENISLQGGGSKSAVEHKDLELDLVAKKRVLIESISNTQKAYNAKYNDILHLLHSSKVPVVSEFHSDFEALKKNNTKLTDVISKSRCGNVMQSDVDECTKLLDFLSSLFDKIKERNEEYENAKILEEETNAKLEEAMQKNLEKTKASVNEESLIVDQVGKEDISFEDSTECSEKRLDRLKYHNYVSKILKKTEDLLQPFLNDDMYKQFRKDCQRAVNLPVNAISPTNSHHLMDKLEKLTDLLDGKKVPVMSRQFSASLHPMGIKYCQVLLARKIVKAGEDVVSSHPETGHAVASVVQSLTIKYPVLTIYLHAYFFRVCPYLVPLDLKPIPGESETEFNNRLGFNYENGEIEETDKFLKRMSGVAQLYCAILVAHKRKGDFGLNPPLGVSELWIWLANFVSMDPTPDISATILLDILEVSGHFMLTCYGLNFQKLLYVICTDYLDKINKVTVKGRGGPVERLKTFLEDVIKVNRISPPKGLLPQQFW